MLTRSRTLAAVFAAALVLVGATGVVSANDNTNGRRDIPTDTPVPPGGNPETPTPPANNTPTPTPPPSDGSSVSTPAPGGSAPGAPAPRISDLPPAQTVRHSG